MNPCSKTPLARMRCRGLSACLIATCLLVGCSRKAAPSNRDPMVPLGLASGDRETAQHLANLLRSHDIPFSGGGSKIYEIDVPASKLGLATALLRTNPLVFEGRFLLSSNTPRTSTPHDHHN